MYHSIYKGHTIAFVFSALCIGCAGQRQIPKRIVLHTETGDWTLICEKGKQELPDNVPIITVVDGRNQEGLLLIPGTPAYEAIVPGMARRAGGTTVFRTPVLVVPSGGGWRLRTADRYVPKEFVHACEQEPYPLKVAIDPPGPIPPKSMGLLPGESIPIEGTRKLK